MYIEKLYRIVEEDSQSEKLRKSIQNFFAVENKAAKYKRILKKIEAIDNCNLQEWLSWLYEDLNPKAKLLRDFAGLDEEWSVTSAEDCGRFLAFLECSENEDLREIAKARVEMLLRIAKVTKTEE